MTIDLKDRRHIFWPHPKPDENGYRACVVVEDESGYFPFGEVSNLPGTRPPMYVGKTEHEATAACHVLNLERFGYSKDVQQSILLSSMAFPSVQVTRDPETDNVRIYRNGDEVLGLCGDEADHLWLRLTKALYPYCLDLNDQLREFEEEE